MSRIFASCNHSLRVLTFILISIFFCVHCWLFVFRRQGNINSYNVEDGTLFYDIWELGVKHKVQQGSLDYFVCDTHQCFRDHGKALQLQHPEDKDSNFTAKISFQLPPQRVSGSMSVNIWGQDQAHEPGIYDFVINLRIQYKQYNEEKSPVAHPPRKVC